MATDPHTSKDRIELLEQQVALLCRALGVENDDPTQVVPGEVVELVRAGHPVHAIRRLRQLTGAGLVSARKLVEVTAETMDTSTGAD